ncbi:MAG: extracellular solute-binding protein [Actinomycetaceae bacterium]|nr:extracellular solute-binding protein [Actinomycetaceae bacterium]MDU0969804.1 extracellular solute-binding protein [Actinomycetaceae bacterium]
MSKQTALRLAAAATALAVASLGMTACSSGNSSDDSSSSSSSSSKSETITYMHRLPDGDSMTKVNDIVAKWNKDHPDKQVKATKFDGKADEMIKKLETDIKAKNGPCLAQLGYAEVPEMYTKGLTEDVTKYADKYKDHYGSSFDLMKVGDKQVGIPQDVGPLVYMYNKDEFQKLGIEVPKTMDELAAAAKKAQASGKYAVAFEPDEAQNWLSAQAAAAGDTWFSTEGDSWKVDTTGPGTEKVAKFWQDMLDSKAALTDERWGDGFKAAVNDGKLIGTIAAAWEPALFVDDFGQNTNVNGKWAVAQLPKFGDEDATGPDGGSGLAVMKGCSDPEGATEFADWFNTQVDDLSTQGLVLAANTKQAATPDKQKEFFGGQDIYAEFATAAKNMKPINYIPGFSALNDPMSKAAASAASGSGKVADVFTQAQDAAQKALKDAGLSVK